MASDAPPDDGGPAFQAILTETATGNDLLDIICQRIRTAARHLQLTPADLREIFHSYQLFEPEVRAPVEGREEKFLVIEAHHLVHGKIGKGALKIMLPRDLARESRNFVEITPRIAEVRPPPPRARWASAAEAWETVRALLRALITGETLSMSLKSQATGAPFSGSEGVILCALGEFDAATGRFFLKPALRGGEEATAHDREVIEALMNNTAEVLSRAGKIAHDRIVHAAETNSTLTARLNLQLPTNVVEGHLRALLQDNPELIIGYADMTVRLRRLLADPAYRPTAGALAREAARLQLEHSILLPASRQRLLQLLEALPEDGFPALEAFQQIVAIFYGRGEIQQTEGQVFRHREPILRDLAAALAAGRLDDSGEPRVLAFFLRTLLDNQAKLMKAALLRRLPPYEPLPVDWFFRFPLFTDEQQAALQGLLPEGQPGKEELRRRFKAARELVAAARQSLPLNEEDHYVAARRAVLGQLLRVLDSDCGLIPCVHRLRFFLTPFTYDTVTPKLGVVTRKPLSVCGSELRPTAMAAGAVFTLETFLKANGANRQRPLDGLTVAIQGLGNAGKGFARLVTDRGARIVGVSDSRGAIIAPAGLGDRTLHDLIQHKNAGRRLDTFRGPAGPESAGGGPFVWHANPDLLLTVKADLLVLTAMPAAVTADNAGQLQCRWLLELTGAAVAPAAFPALAERGIVVLPDNLASSGGLLVSLSEMLQNSFGQQWERHLEEESLRQQIEQSFDAVARKAKKHGVDLVTASDILALQRMRDLAVHRRHLGLAAQQVAAEIRAIGDGETVLIVSDDDDDGVASAAIFRGLIARLNPGREKQTIYVNESLRSPALIELVESLAQEGRSVKRVFVMDRSFPLAPAGQQAAAELARRCRVTMINNHDLPEALARAEARGPQAAKSGGPLSPREMGLRLITPRSLAATVPARHFTTAMILRELARQLPGDPAAQQRVDWQAAIGSCLDVPPETSQEWQLFYAQFNFDDLLEAARAVRMVARAHGFMSAVQAVEGIERPDQMETHKPWEEFTTMYKVLAERVALLVEKIVMENVGRPYVAHFFTAAEVASPLAPAGTMTRCLDLYPWISEHLTRRGDFADKPIIVGQVVQDMLKRKALGVRIRSPRDVELMEAGLPEYFRTGGLPNTAVAKIPLHESMPPERQFYELVDALWWKTVSPTIRLQKRRPA